MNILNEINNILLAALNVQQKQLVDKIMKHNKKEIYSSYDHMFGVGNNRIYLSETINVSRDKIIDAYYSNLDFDAKDEIETQIINIEILVKSFFTYLNKPFESIDLDYNAGKIKIDNREYNIGKLLNQIKKKENELYNYYENINMAYNRKDAAGNRLSSLEFIEWGNAIDFKNDIEEIDDIIKVFNSRFNINSVKDMELKIVISRDPYDIAGMSTNRRWNSCMRLPKDNRECKGGVYRYYLFGDLTEGSIIAYLVDKDDNDINDPYARILIKPFINKDKEIFLAPEERVYYDENYLNENYTKNFLRIITDWTEQQQKEIEGTFFAHPNLYHDSKKFIDRKNKNKEIMSIDNIIYRSINWNKTLPNNGMKVYKHSISSLYVKLINKFIDRWNKYMNELKYESVSVSKYSTIDVDSMTLDNYRNLEFPVNLNSKSKENQESIPNDKQLYTVTNKGKKMFNIHELEEEIKKIHPKIIEIAMNYEYPKIKIAQIYEKNYNSIFSAIDNLSFYSNNESVESYDLILVRKNKENDSHVEFKNIIKHIEGFHDTYSGDSTIFKPLFYVYLVSNGVTDFKEKALFKADVDLGININRIEETSASDMADTFNQPNFETAYQKRLLYYKINFLGINEEFENYIKVLDDLIYRGRDNLTDGIIDFIYNTNVYCDNLYIIDNIVNIKIEMDADLVSYYNLYNIDDNAYYNKDKYYELEREIFKND